MALYLEHFGLTEPPFRITPHTDFFFDGADRGATLEALIYAILHDEGIVKVSGEVGSGKTMLCRVLIERLPPHVATIYLATASLAREEILHAIGAGIAGGFGQMPAILTLQRREQALQVGPHPPAWLDAAEAGSKAGDEIVQLIGPAVGLACMRHGATPLCRRQRTIPGCSTNSGAR